MEIFGADFCSFVNYENSDDFYLYEMGTCKCDPLYSYEHFVSNCLILHFVLNGKGYLILNGKRFDVKAHQAFLIPKDTHAFYQADADDPWEYTWFHIGGPKINHFLYQAGLSVDNPIFNPTGKVDEIEAVVQDMLDHYSQEFYCIGSIYKLCDYIMNYSDSKLEKDENASLKHVRNAIKFIQLKYSEAVKIEDISFACGLDRSYLSRLFKEATGCTLSDYLLTYRMKMASEILKETNDNVQTVAMKVGYTDAFTFSKAFKRHTGMSPSCYKDECITHIS